MSISEVVFAGLFVIYFIYDKIKGDKRDEVIDTLQKDKKELSTANVNLLEAVQKTQQSQADQLNELSKTIIEVSNKMSTMQLNLQDIIDAKLKQQSEEVKEDITKMSNKVDTLLGLVMECDNDACPTKKKVSDYLKRNRG